MSITSATIKLFLPRGDAKSLRTAEISNWSGKAIAAPRTEIDDLLAREELEKSGVYILTGIDPNSGSPRAYIGEAEVIRERLKQHKAKEFWVSAVVFVSKDENLTKALSVLQRQDDSHISSRCEKVLSKTAPFSSKTVFSYLRKMQAFQARARQLPLFMVVA